ncbi:MAG: FadR/GntR family transcriptional regulator [Acidimicrobiales bacterium]
MDTMFEPALPVRAYEQVVRQIEGAILDGRLRPDQHLPSERQLVKEFGVSRSTLREALRVLQSRGLIQSRAGDPHGAVVLPFSTSSLRVSMAALARVDHLTLVELLQFRVLVDGWTCRLAASQRSEEQLLAMDRAMAEMRSHLDGDLDTFAEADLAFHAAVARAAGNKLLEVCGSVVHDVVLRLVSSKINSAPDRRGQMRESCERHAQVLAAIRSGDPEGAAEITYRNIVAYYSGYLDAEQRRQLSLLGDGFAARGQP